MGQPPPLDIREARGSGLPSLLHPLLLAAAPHGLD